MWKLTGIILRAEIYNIFSGIQIDPIISGQHISIYRGERNGTVKTPYGYVITNPGSVFVLKTEPHGLRLLNVTGINLTFVTSSGKCFSINPGTESFITNESQTAPFANDNSVARRPHVQSAQLGDSSFAYFTRFSIASLLQHSDLSQIRSSGATSDHQKLFKHIIKMAVITNQLYGVGGFTNSASPTTSQSVESPKQIVSQSTTTPSSLETQPPASD